MIAKSITFQNSALSLAICLLTIVFSGGHSTRAVAQEGNALTESDFKIIGFDEAMKDQLIRSMPLNLALPKDYEILVLKPATAGAIWARPADLEHIERTGEVTPEAGYFHGRLTLNVGYDSSKNSFFCGPGCDEDEISIRLEAAGAAGVKSQKHMVNGIPVLLIQGDGGSLQGVTRKKFYLAYIAVLIDTNVMLISYRAPLDSKDDGQAVWKSFTKALTETTDATKPALAPQPGFQGYLDLSKRSSEFRPIADEFIAAAAAGDRTRSLGLFSRKIVNTVGREVVQSHLATQVLPFFEQFNKLGSSVTIAPTNDQFGSVGFVFYLSMVPKQGEERPFAIYVVEEDGSKVIANIVLDPDFKGNRR
jgi:hypothetical protein